MRVVFRCPSAPRAKISRLLAQAGHDLTAGLHRHPERFRANCHNPTLPGPFGIVHWPGHYQYPMPSHPFLLCVSGSLLPSLYWRPHPRRLPSRQTVIPSFVASVEEARDGFSRRGSLPMCSGRTTLGKKHLVGVTVVLRPYRTSPPPPIPRTSSSHDMTDQRTSR
ncbi:hypothetical protein LX36DRAFT_196023 [Colletotrichum falcatum]|nr:hypothetical protein LX36DRAFT_196023 [Colletotrichum falcatum]